MQDINKASSLNVKSSEVQLFTFTRDLSYIASILSANVNFTHVRTFTLKLRDSGNPPLYGHLTLTGQLTLSLGKESPFIFLARTPR